MSSRVQVLLFLLFLFILSEAMGILYFLLAQNPSHRPNYSIASSEERNSIAGQFYYEREPWGAWHRPNREVQHTQTCFSVKMRSNSIGARDEEFKPNSKQKRVFALGDSFLEGFGVEKEASIADILERKLGIEVLNFGAAGDVGPLQYQLLYESFRNKYIHDLVAIFLLPDNDFTDNWYPYFQARGGIHPFRYRPYYKQKEDSFVAWYPTTQPDSKLSLYSTKDFSQMNAKEKFYHFYKNFFFSSVIVFSIRRNWKMHQLRPRRYSGYRDHSDEQRRAVLWSIEKIAALANKKPVLVVVIPRIPDLEVMQKANPELLLFRELERLTSRRDNISILDLSAAFLASKENKKSFFLECDGHWNERGHQTAADAVAIEIEKLLSPVISAVEL